MKSLAEIQDRFQRAILAGDETILAEIADSPRERREVLFSVYRDAYTLRLVDVLGNDYERLKAHMGAEPFARMAHTYILHTPSRTPSARWYGRGLPVFLASHSPYREEPVLAGIAGIERALNDAFDAADAPPLTLADLAGLAPGEWPELVFAAHPCVQRLNLDTNADDIWTAARDGVPAPAERAVAETRQLIFYRPDAQAMFRVLAADEAMMWDEAARGVRFSVLCELLAMFGEADASRRAAAYLRGWIETGLLARPAAAAA